MNDTKPFGTMFWVTADGQLNSEIVDKPPTLERMQEIVGGWLELVPGFSRFQDERAVAYCDEEGRLKHLPVNALASEAWWQSCPAQRGQTLRGTVLILHGNEAFMRLL